MRFVHSNLPCLYCVDRDDEFFGERYEYASFYGLVCFYYIDWRIDRSTL